MLCIVYLDHIRPGLKTGHWCMLVLLHRYCIYDSDFEHTIFIQFWTHAQIYTVSETMVAAFSEVTPNIEKLPPHRNTSI